MAIHQIQDKDQPYFPFMHVAVFFIFLKCIVEQILNARQFYRLKQSAKKIPKEIRMLGIDPERYRLAMEYEHSKLGFDMLVLSIKTGYEFIFTLTYAMPLIWNTISFPIPFVTNEEFKRGFAFLCIETARMKVIDIPIQLYETFVIQEKFGFSKRTLLSFFQDACFESLIMLFVPSVILSGYLQLIEHAPDNFFYLVSFLIGLSLLIQTIFHNYIQPIFSNFQELQEGELKVDINELAEGLNFPLKHIMRTRGFRRQDHSNAFLIGMWRDKRIVIQELLMEQLQVQEVVAVVCHELGHWKHNHFNITMLIFYARVTLFFLLSSFFRSNDAIFLSFGFTDKSTFVGTALFYSLFSPMNSIFEFLTLLITRYFEFQADAFACNQGYGYYLMSGLVKVQVENANTLYPDPWYAWAKFSHPGLFERINKIKQKIYEIESQNGLSNSEIEEKIKNFMDKHVFVNRDKQSHAQEKSHNKNNERKQQQQKQAQNDATAEAASTIHLSSASLSNSNQNNQQNGRGLNILSQGDQQLILNQQYQRNCQVIQSQHNYLNNLANQQLFKHTLQQPIFMPQQPQPIQFPQLQNHNIQNTIPNYLQQQFQNPQQILLQSSQQKSQSFQQQNQQGSHDHQQMIIQLAQAQQRLDQQQQQQQFYQPQQQQQQLAQMTQSSLPNLQNYNNLLQQASDQICQDYSFPIMGLSGNSNPPSLDQQQRQDMINYSGSYGSQRNGKGKNKQFRSSLSEISDFAEVNRDSEIDRLESKKLQFVEDALYIERAVNQTNNSNPSSNKYLPTSDKPRIQSEYPIQSESEVSSILHSDSNNHNCDDFFKDQSESHRHQLKQNPKPMMGIPFVSSSAVSNRFFPNYWGRF